MIIQRKKETRRHFLLARSDELLYFSAMSARTAAQHFKRDFSRQLAGGLQLADLFEGLPQVAFFAKDSEGRFVHCNAQVLQILGCKHEWQMLGKTDSDFFPPAITAVYREEDCHVMRSGLRMLRYVQMVPDSSGPVRWYLVTKIPLRNSHGQVCGIAGAMMETHEIGGALESFHRIEPALRHMHLRFREPMRMRQLSALVHLSERQFLRLFQQLLGEGPMHHLVRQRIQAACHDLMATDHSAQDVALDCGFYDQSAFTRAFRTFTGLTPSAYRKQYRANIKMAQS
jgi:PAS domain S-box-containing protein